MAEEKKVNKDGSTPKKRGRPKGSKNKTTEQRALLDLATQGNKMFKNNWTEQEIVEMMNRPYQCTMCGRRYDKQKGNFPHSSADVYKSNNKYLTICNDCLEKMFDSYVDKFNGDRKKAVQRICLRFNYYFNEGLYMVCARQGYQGNMMKAYISKCNMSQYMGKDFDTYITELETNAPEVALDIYDENGEPKESSISQEVIDFFGEGFTTDEYNFLEREYESWIERYECSTKAQESIFQQLSITSLLIRRATQQGDSTEVVKLQKSQQDLMNSAKIKPIQQDEKMFGDVETVGTLIKAWEDEEKLPVPEPLDEWKDVDGIKKNALWFQGGIAQCMGLDNPYIQQWEDLIEPYTAHRPDDDEGLHLDDNEDEDGVGQMINTENKEDNIKDDVGE